MKKTRYMLGLLVLVANLAACQQAAKSDSPPMPDRQVSLRADIRPYLKTRAGSISLPEGYLLRCILEVWHADATRIVHRNELILEDAATIDFTFELENTGSYIALLWADFIEEGAASTPVETPIPYNHYTDGYYRTDSEKGLQEVSLLPDAYRINHESRDAFYAKVYFTKEEAAYQANATLTRPFGNLSISETTATLLEQVNEVTCSYEVPATFNLLAGQAGTATHPVTQTVPPARAEGANLFFDYIFASKVGEVIASPVTLTFKSTSPELLLEDYTVPANNLPIAQNKRTMASGSIIREHTEVITNPQVTLSITISTDWDTSAGHALPEYNGGDLPSITNKQNPFDQTQ